MLCCATGESNCHRVTDSTPLHSILHTPPPRPFASALECLCCCHRHNIAVASPLLTPLCLLLCSYASLLPLCAFCLLVPRIAWWRRPPPPLTLHLSNDRSSDFERVRVLTP